jgi:hypothetical protein
MEENNVAGMVREDHATTMGRYVYSHLVLIGIRSMVRRYLSLG